MSKYLALGAGVVAVLIVLVIVLPGPSRPSVVLPRSIADVQLDTHGWSLEKQSDRETIWHNEEGDVLGLTLTTGATLTRLDESAARSVGRGIAKDLKRGLVSADLVDVHGAPSFKLIYKQEVLPAYRYTGMLMVHLQDGTLAITTASEERGVTGQRESIVASMLIRQGRYDPRKTDANGRILGWFKDPYDSSYDSTTITSLADDVQYDQLLPHDPLTKVRTTLRGVISSLQFK